MKANELMLGDLVQGHLPNTPSKVVGIPNEYRLAVITPSGAYMELSIDDLQPIPLTDKILEKNGFQYFHRDYASLSYDDKFRLLMVKWPDENGFGGLWTLYDIIEIEFVHELQRALSICKIDKNIVL